MKALENKRLAWGLWLVPEELGCLVGQASCRVRDLNPGLCHLLEGDGQLCPGVEGKSVQASPPPLPSCFSFSVSWLESHILSCPSI